jgi:hypothetical protein
VAREASRIDAAFTERKDALVEHVRARYKDTFDASNLEQVLKALADDLVNPDAITDAAQEGINAVPDREHMPKASDVAEIWVGKVRKYARQFPGRMADEVSAAAYEAESEARARGMTDSERIDFVLSAIDAKAEAFRSDALLYSEPAWGAGNQGYGQTLSQNDVLMDWETEAGACDECESLEDGNPYTMAALPCWPGDTHPNCRCRVTPDDESWQQIFGDAAA